MKKLSIWRPAYYRKPKGHPKLGKPAAYFECRYFNHRIKGRLCRHPDCFGICGSAHRTRVAAERHCAKLNRAEKP